MTGSEERPTATFSLRFPGSSGDVWRVCSQHASDLYHMTIKLCKEQVTVTGAEGTSLALLAPPPLLTHTSQVTALGRADRGANFPEHVVDSLPDDLNTGIYYGWGCVGDGDVHKMVMSIGWNPFYKNTKKSVETHIIHHFQEDFYGEMLSIIIVGYIRPERSFDSLDALIAAINSDIEEAKKQLDLPEFKKLKDRYFNTTSHKIMNGH
uniref:riboflavin kinase n=1 Tax=Leptobrachium leishanense TaxID=445787 RepID=A0A8C5MU30_9ANUR